jgi:hypothetical protein
MPRLKTSMTQNVHDIDDPINDFNNLIPLFKLLIKEVSDGTKAENNSY